MSTQPTFSHEIAGLLHASEGKPLSTCIQCGTCSGTCPVANFMDLTPRRMIGLINAGYKDDVLKSNTFWLCASCFHCTVRCPSGIDIAEAMYALKRYSMWRDTHKEGLIGPIFSETFVKTIAKYGRSFEPVLAPSYMFSMWVKDFIQEAVMASTLMLKGRIPILPSHIKRIDNFRRMISRIIPLGDFS